MIVRVEDMDPDEVARAVSISQRLLDFRLNGARVGILLVSLTSGKRAISILVCKSFVPCPSSALR